MFKNLTIFEIEKPIDTSALNYDLGQKQFVLTKRTEESSIGWSSPAGSGSAVFAMQSDNRILIKATIEKRIVPPAVVKKELASRVKKIETDEERVVSNREKKIMREDIVLELLPRVFPKQTVVYAWFDLTKEWFIVDSASNSNVDAVCSLLRKTIGSLPIKPLTTEVHPEVAMTHWMNERSAPDPFRLGYACTLKEGESNKSIVFKEADTTSDEAVALKDQMYVSKHELTWSDRAKFNLTEELKLTSFELASTTVEEYLDDAGYEDYADFISAEFTLYSGEIRVLITDLLEVLK